MAKVLIQLPSTDGNKKFKLVEAERAEYTRSQIVLYQKDDVVTVKTYGENGKAVLIVQSINMGMDYNIALRDVVPSVFPKVIIDTRLYNHLQSVVRFLMQTKRIGTSMLLKYDAFKDFDPATIRNLLNGAPVDLRKQDHGELAHLWAETLPITQSATMQALHPYIFYKNIIENEKNISVSNICYQPDNFGL